MLCILNWILLTRNASLLLIRWSQGVVRRRRASHSLIVVRRRRASHSLIASRLFLLPRKLTDRFTASRLLLVLRLIVTALCLQLQV